MPFTVKLEQFEGPLDLLLELIQKEKLEITLISLAKVTNSYLGHLKGNLDISSDNLSDFLVVAARLILIKSKALLPILELTPEEEDSIADLEARLALYKKFKEVSQLLGLEFDKRQFSFSRKGFEGVKQGFFPPPDIDAAILEKTMSRILAEMPKAEKLVEERVKEVITLEQKIIELKSSLQQRIEMSFKTLTASAKNKTEIIVTFLAILELFKAKIINVEQKEIFGEIMISKKEIAV
ncbi:MAG: segregation/condensation protein A [bacterium]|nr:segregation/condensation protein A [bacterium]